MSSPVSLNSSLVSSDSTTAQHVKWPSGHCEKCHCCSSWAKHLSILNKNLLDEVREANSKEKEKEGGANGAARSHDKPEAPSTSVDSSSGAFSSSASLPRGHLSEMKKNRVVIHNDDFKAITSYLHKIRASVEDFSETVKAIKNELTDREERCAYLEETFDDFCAAVPADVSMLTTIMHRLAQPWQSTATIHFSDCFKELLANEKQLLTTQDSSDSQPKQGMPSIPDSLDSSTLNVPRRGLPKTDSKGKFTPPPQIAVTPLDPDPETTSTAIEEMRVARGGGDNATALVGIVSGQSSSTSQSSESRPISPVKKASISADESENFLRRLESIRALVPTRSTASLHAEEATETSNVHRTRDDLGYFQINDYVILKEIGRGSYGVVKLGIHNPTGEYRAIKVLKMEDPDRHRTALRRRSTEVPPVVELAKPHEPRINVPHPPLQPRDRLNVTEEPQPPAKPGFEVSQQLAVEIAIMKKLRHRHVVRLYEVIYDTRRRKVYLVMQYVNNGPILSGLHTPDSTCNPLPVGKVRHCIRQIISGLDYLHRHGILHRDIKPDNILIDEHDNAFLADFGVSDLLSSAARRGSKKLTLKGTMCFVSPEVCRGEAAAHGKAVDVWALGVTLYALLFGRLPFIGDSHGELMSNIQNHSPVFPRNCHASWRSVVMAMLNKDPIKRITLRRLREHPFFTDDGHLDPALSKPGASISVSPRRRPSLQLAGALRMGRSVTDVRRRSSDQESDTRRRPSLLEADATKPGASITSTSSRRRSSLQLTGAVRKSGVSIADVRRISLREADATKPGASITSTSSQRRSSFQQPGVVSVKASATARASVSGAESHNLQSTAAGRVKAGSAPTGKKKEEEEEGEDETKVRSGGDDDNIPSYTSSDEEEEEEAEDSPTSVELYYSSSEAAPSPSNDRAESLTRDDACQPWNLSLTSEGSSPASRGSGKIKLFAQDVLEAVGHC